MNVDAIQQQGEKQIGVVSKWLTETLPTQALNILPKLVIAAIIIVAGFFFSKLCGNLLVKLLKKNNVDETVHYFLRRMLVVTMGIVFVLFALSAVGVNINSFIAALGAAGITAGLGLQTSISQFASGLEILFVKPFKKGDYIEVEDVNGVVEEIHFMNTTLLTLDNKRVIVPNSHITGNNLINYTSENKRRVDLTFSISYSDDIAKAKQVIESCAVESPYVIDDPNTVIAVKEHSSSSIDIASYVWCKSEDYWKAYFDMQERVKLAFDENGVQIPFTQMDVHLVK